MHSHPCELAPRSSLIYPVSTATTIKQIGLDLGFQQVGITDTRLDAEHANYRQWLARHYHGEMGYMARHGTRRSRPADLVPGTLRVISARMDYLPEAGHQLANESLVIRERYFRIMDRYLFG